MSGLYIHIPFCRKKCFYCDFYSREYNSGSAKEYVACLCWQIDGLKESFRTIFVGGGTPSVLEKALLGKLFKSLKRVSKSAKEFTVEVNPESLDRQKIDLFLQSGCNRLSIGVQSLFEDKLKKLGRIHSSQKAQDAVYLAKEMGFVNISIDLIFGVWGETLDSWKQELERAVVLPVKHISVYGLTPEKKSPFFRALKRGDLEQLSEEISAQMYEFSIEFLERNGFFQYEVSNFARRRYLCRHNWNYWQNNFYIGLGPSAVSYVEGVRMTNVANVKEYIRRVNKGENTVASQEKLGRVRRAKEAAAILIRTAEGIDLAGFRQKYGVDFGKLNRGTIDNLKDMGLLRYYEAAGKIKRICLTKKGFLFSDTVSSSFC